MAGNPFLHCASLPQQRGVGSAITRPMPKRTPTPASPPIDVTASLFRGTRRNVVRTRKCPWAEFAAGLSDLANRWTVEPVDESPEAFEDAKVRLQGIVLAHVEGTRSDTNCGPHTALVIDVDALPCPRKEFLARCAAYTCAVYETPTSGQHGKGTRLRVIAALSEPLPVELVKAARRALARDLGLDPHASGVAKADSVSQVMFVGRVGGTPERRVWTFASGPCWQPPADMPAEAPRVKAVASGALKPHFGPDVPPPLPRTLLKAIEPKAGGQRYGGRDLMRGLGGTYARKGYHPDAIAFALADAIPSSQPDARAQEARLAAEQWYSGDRMTAGVTEIVKHFEDISPREEIGPRVVRAIDKACRQPGEPPGWPTADAGVFTEADARELEWWAARNAKREAATKAAQTPLLASHPAQDGTELHLHAATGWPWILQKGSSYWIHANDPPPGGAPLAPSAPGTYRNEIVTAELEASVARNMAGLISDDDRTPSELRARWIKPLDYLRSTYMARSHTYDPPTNTLTLSSLRWANIPARKHPHIDRWLRALFGRGYDSAAQWVSSLGALDRPAPCLYLPGPPGLGKSLLADGLSALWCRPAPVDMAEAIDAFNEATGACPLVFTDEGFPPGLDFSAFRKMVTQHSRRVNAKYRAKYDVEGCARFIIAANNDDVLRYQKIGTLTQDDLAAIADRLLVIECQPEAKAEVERLDTSKAALYEIAEHALWLASTVALQPAGERMAAKPSDGERLLASVVVARHSHLLAHVREACTEGGGEGVFIPKRVLGTSREVWINVPQVLACMQASAATGASRLSNADVREFANSFSLRREPEQHKVRGVNTTWRILDRARLDAAFAELD